MLRLPLADLVRTKRPARLPTVLTREEVALVLGSSTGTPRVIGWLLYGAGLRLLECLRLRVKDIDLGGKMIRLREGKGNRDRVALLPAVVQGALHEQLAFGVGRRGARVAVGVPGHANRRRAARWPGAAASPARDGDPARGQGCRAAGRIGQAGDMPNASALVRDALAGERIRHSHGAGVARAPEKSPPIFWPLAGSHVRRSATPRGVARRRQ